MASKIGVPPLKGQVSENLSMLKVKKKAQDLVLSRNHRNDKQYALPHLSMYSSRNISIPYAILYEDS